MLGLICTALVGGWGHVLARPSPPEQREVHRVGAVAMRPQLDVWAVPESRDAGENGRSVESLDGTTAVLHHVADDDPGLGEVR